MRQLQVTNEMALAAAMKAQSIGLLPKAIGIDDLGRACDLMVSVIQAALDAESYNKTKVARPAQCEPSFLLE